MTTPCRCVAVALLAIVAPACAAKVAKPLPPQIITRTGPSIEIKVPIPVRIELPPELLEPIVVPPLIFLAPSDPAASTALDAQGERSLRELLEKLKTRIRALIAAAQAKPNVH